MIDTFDVQETIVAQATARQPGYPRGIIRVSGPDCRQVLKQSFRLIDQTEWEDCPTATRFSGQFVCDDLNTAIPVDLLFWPNQNSYTRQISAEIHAPGALPLLDAILNQLCKNGARLAKPGEFTLRAFLSGRMDLTEAEAVLGVIDAQDQAHLNTALKQLSGGLSRPLDQSRQELLMVLAQLEAGLDFVEEDIEFISADELLSQLANCRQQLEKLREQLAQREQSDSGVRLLLFGRPNTGKSSLFNLLTSRFGITDNQAIVSSQSGTTRDYIEGHLAIQGISFTLVDTAGIDQTALEASSSSNSGSPLEMAQRRSQTLKSETQLTLLCFDSSQPPIEEEQQQLLSADPNQLICLNKSDLPEAIEWGDVLDEHSQTAVRLSAQTGEGLDRLIQQVMTLTVGHENSESLPSTAVRCAAAVNDAIQALHNSTELVQNFLGDELVAGEIRMALEAIGRITGAVYTDDILDVVFRQFCIGK